jgi:hypothetical protein
MSSAATEMSISRAGHQPQEDDDTKDVSDATKAFIQRSVEACSVRLQEIKQEMSHELETGIAEVKQTVERIIVQMTEALKEHSEQTIQIVDSHRRIFESRIRQLEAAVFRVPVPDVVP